MADVPMYPGYVISNSDDEAGAFEKNAVLIRIETLVPKELLDRAEALPHFLRRIADHAEDPYHELRELTRGR